VRHLRLIIEGDVAGTRSLIRVTNDIPIAVDTDDTKLAIVGQIKVLGRDAGGKVLPVTAGINVLAGAADPQTTQCLGFTARQQLFGFENVEQWSSSVGAVHAVTSPITQGCSALGVDGQGFIPIEGGPFSTAGLTVTPAISVDLFIPDHQPNPFWLGALQTYLTCPSDNFFNQYIGQVELTGKPQNRFSTLRFPLPIAIANMLRQPRNDCFFSLALNVNQTNRTWIIDNLRFVP